MTTEKKIFHGVDVKRFQYEEFATNLSDKRINITDLISKNLFSGKSLDQNCIMINLEKDITRYNNTLEEFKKVSVSNFSHLKGTYWKDKCILEDDLNTVLHFISQFNTQIPRQKIEIDEFSFTNDSRINIQDGPLACYVSHLRSMIWGYLNFNDYTIICEDDIFIANTELIEEYLKQVPEDWDIVMLNACSKNKIYNSKFYKFDDEFHSCHFYIVRNSSLPVLFKGMYPIIDQVDVLVSNLRDELNIYNIEETVYQKNISTNTQNNLFVIFNSPHYGEIRKNITIVENELLHFANLILKDNQKRNKIIVQNLLFDVLWNYVTQTDQSEKWHENLENYECDLEKYADISNFIRLLESMRFVLQCCKKGIKDDDTAKSVLSRIFFTLENFKLHNNKLKAWGFGSTANTYLTEENVVKKYNDKLRWVTEDHDDTEKIFKSEISLLQKIQSLNLRPKLIDFNEKDMTITTEYSGLSLWDQFNLPENWKSQIVEIFSKLDEVGIYYPEFRLQNILVLNGNITFVDYGLAQFSGESNNKNLNFFLDNLEKLNLKLADVEDRNTRLQLITTYLNNHQI